jgi:hypothetical protein
MAKDIDCEIKSIIGEITEVNSKNEQKVVALASWNGREEKIEIRNYNVSAEMLLKGIGFTPEEAGELLYILLASTDVKYDPDRVREILQEQEDRDVDVQKLVSDLPPEQEVVDVAALIAAEEYDPINNADAYETASYGNRRPSNKTGLHRITPKKNGLFAHMYQ